MKRIVTNSAFLLFLSIGVLRTGYGRVPAEKKPVTVNLVNADGRTVGTAILTEADHGVQITLDIKNLPAGIHLLHIHQFPKSEPPDFK